MKAVELALLTTVIAASLAAATTLIQPHTGSTAKTIAKLLERGDGVYTLYTPYPVHFTADGHIVVEEPSGRSVAEAKNVKLLPSRGQES